MMPSRDSSGQYDDDGVDNDDDDDDGGGGGVDGDNLNVGPHYKFHATQFLDTFCQKMSFFILLN